jgi:hypothetical protein
VNAGGHAGSVALVAVIAQPTPTPSQPGGGGEDYGKSAPVGLVVIIVFFVAVFFLVRSMNKHLRRVPASFDPPPQEQPGDRPDERDARPDERPPDGAKRT